jgi:hypothetical protein
VQAKYLSLRKLLIANGCGLIAQLDHRGNASYTSKDFIKEMLECMSDAIELQILKEVYDSPAIGVTIDESQDIATHAQMDIYWRLMDMKTGRSKQRFAGLRRCKNGTSDHLTSIVTTFLKEKGVSILKVLAFGSDGANAMTGVKNGVATQLQFENPRMVVAHCSAHNLALAPSQAAESVEYLAQKFDPALTSIFVFYHYSSTKTESLLDKQLELEDPVLAMKRAVPTRWASRSNAVATINDTMPSLLEDLADHAQNGHSAAAIGLNTLTHDYRFVATTAAMDDILPIINILSKAMQKKSSDFTTLVKLVPPVLAALSDLKTSFGPAYIELPERLALHGDLHGIRLRYAHPDNPVRKNFHRGVYLRYLDSLVEHITKRFPSYDILEALCVLFDPDRLMSAPAQLADYGKSALALLVDHYGGTVAKGDISRRVRLEWKTASDNPTAPRAHSTDVREDAEVIPPYLVVDHVEAEWAVARRSLQKDIAKWRNHNTGSTMTAADVICILIKRYWNTFPEICKLGIAAEVICTNTADNERGFSDMKLHKTRLRGTLSDETLGQLMMISLEGKQTAPDCFHTMLFISSPVLYTSLMRGRT